MSTNAINTPQQWFASPLGQYLLSQEQAYHDEVVADIFGFHAVQLGLPEHDLLRASRIPHRLLAGPEGPVRLKTNFTDLPFANQSMDLLLLPHVLEFSDQPHQILREVDRVMMPEGRVIITGFNPWSLWGLRRALGITRHEYPWNGDFISLVRLKDWLALLGFDVSAGRLGCYVPPVSQERWLQRLRFMEQAGDRWWGIAGGVYLLQAIKRVHGMRLILPKWHERMRAEASLAPTASRAARMGGRQSRQHFLRQVK